MNPVQMLAYTDSTNITDILGNLDTPDMAKIMSVLEPAEFRFKFSGLGEFYIILRSVSLFRSNCQSSYFCYVSILAEKNSQLNQLDMFL